MSVSIKVPSYFLVVILISFLAIVAVSDPIAAQEDRYGYCQQRAAQVSGYYGPVPRERRGSVLRGAFRGAAAGALAGGIFGKKGKRRKAAKRGAAGGALLGALIAGGKKSRARKEEDRRRRSYEFEISACMSAGNNQ